ncbi:hypothetical protein ACQKJ1_28400 [Methylorubrum rhodesianum]|uniref:hypothetical protein n=1 Tax=Methylorubrum rhodesianum TaxID=29427 RepID=UPI003D04E0E3
MIDFDLTRALRSAFMSLGFAYPVRLVAGFALSSLVYLIASGLYIDCPDKSFLAVIDQNPKTFIVSLGIIISFGLVLFSPMVGSDNLASWLDAIEETLKRGNFTQVQKALLWQRIATRIVESIDLNLELNQDKLERIAREEEQFLRESEDEQPPISG